MIGFPNNKINCQKQNPKQSARIIMKKKLTIVIQIMIQMAISRASIAIRRCSSSPK